MGLTAPENSDTIPRMRCRWIAVAIIVASVRFGAASATVPVVATIFPLADLARQVGGEEVEVATLLPPGASPHTFEPTPLQMRAVAHARVFVQVGAGLDNWTAKLLSAGRADLKVVTVTDGLKLLGSATGTEEPAQRLDPHVWLDPLLVRDHVVPMIVDALAAVGPEHRAVFESRVAQLCDQLTRLDADIRTALASVSNKRYVAFHSAWRYFGLRYGLEEVAVVEAFPGKEPSAQEIAAVVQKARAAGVRAILIEPQFPARIAEQIAREFGGRTALVDPLGGPQLAGRNQYVDLMRYNLRSRRGTTRWQWSPHSTWPLRSTITSRLYAVCSFAKRRKGLRWHPASDCGWRWA